MVGVLGLTGGPSVLQQVPDREGPAGTGSPRQIIPLC